MSTEQKSRAWPSKPASACWWLRVLMAALFIFQIGCVRCHLLTEAHHDDVYAAVDETTFHQDGHDDGESHHSDQHKSHSASEHLIQMVAKHQTSLPVIHFLVSESSVCLTRHEELVAHILDDCDEAPGESPPNPLQPRAPPLA